jgi:hypothetical protein
VKPLPVGLCGFCCRIEAAATERETLERNGAKRRNAEENSLMVRFVSGEDEERWTRECGTVAIT